MLVKARIVHLRTLEDFTVQWNPQEYRVERRNRLRAPAALACGPLRQCSGASERFVTRLYLDSTDCGEAERDLRRPVEVLERWAEPEAPGGLPPRLLFLWGSFRFQGVIETLGEEWVGFDPDGTPHRGWVDLSLVR